MDLRIGVSQTAKELDIELADDADADAIRAQFEQAIADEATFWVTDRKGKQVGVHASKIAYVEIGAPDSGRRIGFGG